MTDRELLLKNVIADPDDDTARLVYADWLDEHDEEQLAEFIRLQVEHGRKWPDHLLRPRCRCRSCQIFRRCEKLSTLRNRVKWAGPAYVPSCSIRFYRGFVETIHIPVQEFVRSAKEIFSALPVLYVLLVDAEPHRVTSGYWWYSNEGREFDMRFSANLPDELFSDAAGTELIAERFDERVDAMIWLSNKCVAFGRRRAGLPPLPKAIAL